MTEEITAALAARWPERFCSDEQARRRRSNGGRLRLGCCARWEARKNEMGRRVRSAGARGDFRHGYDARRRTARGQREQESGDEWRTRGVVFLKLDHCSSDSVLNSDG